MFLLQWRCVACGHHSMPIPMPFEIHGPVPPVDLCCAVCEVLTEHTAVTTDSDSLTAYRAKAKPKAIYRASERRKTPR